MGRIQIIDSVTRFGTVVASEIGGSQSPSRDGFIVLESKYNVQRM